MTYEQFLDARVALHARPYRIRAVRSTTGFHWWPKRIRKRQPVNSR